SHLAHFFQEIKPPMVYRIVVCLLSVAFGLSRAAAQAPQAKGMPNRVNPQQAHVRMIAIVPMIGSGTEDDPRRPDFVSPPQRGSKFFKPDPNGILGFNFVMSDDKQHAIVEFVARNRSAFNQLLADKRPDVKVFEKGKAKRSDIEAELKKVKK